MFVDEIDALQKKPRNEVLYSLVDWATVTSRVVRLRPAREPRCRTARLWCPPPAL